MNKEIPSTITQNLNPAFELHDYQKDAFARFIHCLNGTFPGKENPLHLLFNMATGSGKTLIMAGLILCLYEKGYRNFLFFVDSTNIIEKTKDNFLNRRAAKYLFNENIYFEGKRVSVTQVDNFDKNSLPKGEHLADGDRWKEEFLQKICAEYQSKVLTEDRKYRIIGVPSFYNEDRENQFREDLDNALRTVPQTQEQDS